MRKGQSFLEVILALAVFIGTVAAVTAMITGGFGLVEQSDNYVQAKLISEQGIETARAVHAGAWNAQAYTSYATETIGKFTRTTEYSAVCRDVTHALSTCPASYIDVQTKLAVVSVSWEANTGVMNTVRQSAYFTNWNSRDWGQTSWSGGAGQQVWSDETRYDTGDSIDVASSPGNVRLGSAPDGQWTLSGGGIFTDTSDTDFNQGSFSNTVLQGSGEAAYVSLGKSFQWAEHQDSASTTTRDINSMSALSSSDVWAAADNGEILHYDGMQWSVYADVGSAHIRGISMRTTTDGWAVGQSGKIYRYNGSVWLEQADTGDHVWRDVAAIAENDVWAVGSDTEDEDDGFIAHYNGISWTVSQPPSSRSIRAISGLSVNDIWAVGMNGRIWHYDGTAWSLSADTGGETWNDIAMISASSGWVVGNDGALAQWNGTLWTEQTIPSSANIRSVFALSLSNIWATGNSGRVWRYDGFSWSLQTDMGDETWRVIAMITPNLGWIGGSGGKIGAYDNFYNDVGMFSSRILDSESTVTTWSVASWLRTLPLASNATVSTRAGNTAAPDGSWSLWSSELANPLGSSISSPSPRRYLQYRITLGRGTVPASTPRVDMVSIIYNLATTQNLKSISAVSQTDVWAAGNSGKIIHFNGSAWVEFSDTGSETWNDSSFVSASNGWLAGDNGALAQWNGATWSESTIPSSADIKTISALSSGDIWAAGANGRIWHYNGASWSLHTDTGDEVWNGIAFTSISSGWVVGNNGALAQWNGATWSESTIPSSADIKTISALSSGDIWAAGANGRIWHYNGASWSLHTDTGDEVWNGIAFANADDGWVVGSSGAIRRWLNTAWTPFSSPTGQTLEASALANAKLGWAVGQGGTVLQFYREALYPSIGTLQSSAFSLRDSSPVQSIEWVNTNANCVLPCAMQFQIRTAPDSGGAPGAWTQWHGANGAGTYFTVQEGTFVPQALNGNAWVQYRAELLSDGTSTPVLSEVRVNYK